MHSFELEDIKRIAELPYDWELLNNCTILISGGTGFLGTFFTNVMKYRNKIFNSNIKVVSFSRRGGVSDNTVTCLKSDIAASISYNGRADYVIHLASNTHPEQYKNDPVGTIVNNIYGCKNLLDYSKDNNVKRFLLASSCEVYGECLETPVDEKYCGYIDFNTARAGYNEAKRTCEALCQSYLEQYGVDSVIVRLSRVFGVDNTKADTKAMAQFINKAIKNEDIVLKSDGKQKYSYVYIADAVSGIICALLGGKCGDAYNVSNDFDGMTLSDIAEYIAGKSGKKVIYEIQNDSSVSKAKNALLSNEKIKSIGYTPLYSTKNGIERTINILRGEKM